MDHLKLYHTEEPLEIWSTQVPAIGVRYLEFETGRDDGTEIAGNLSEGETENKNASSMRHSNHKCRVHQFICQIITCLNGEGLNCIPT